MTVVYLDKIVSHFTCGRFKCDRTEAPQNLTRLHIHIVHMRTYAHCIHAHTHTKIDVNLIYVNIPLFYVIDSFVFVPGCLAAGLSTHTLTARLGHFTRHTTHSLAFNCQIRPVDLLV